MSKTPTICLTMIIKNESKIIERCLTAAAPACDFMAICDTGSTDNTVEIVENFFKTNNIKGQLHHHEWKNFGHNRSLSLIAAKKSGADYALCIDADMILEIKSHFDKTKLTKDCYSIPQQTPSLYYYNIRIMSLKKKWFCVGVTHEYYSCKGPHTKENTDMLVINDIGDGGAKADKFERDIRLLTQGLIDEPNNERYMFYLAQSYFDTQQYDKATKWYKERIAKAGHFIEEIYYSYFRLALIAEYTKKTPKEVEGAYLTAWKCLSSRAEPLYEVARYLRCIGNNERAYSYAKIGSTIPFPANQILFISKNVYDYKIKDELAMAAMNLGKMEEAANIWSKLLKRGMIPEFDLNRVRSLLNNCSAHVKNINNMERLIEDVKTSNDPKDMLDLAQAYIKNNQWSEAKEWFERSIDKADKDDKWYARYMLAKCYEHDNKWSDALNNYLESYNDSGRAEPINSIVSYYRTNKKHRLALDFVKIGLSLSVINEKYLDINCYTWNFIYELTIISYYLGLHDLGLLACEKILAGWVPNRNRLNDLNYWRKHGVERNRMFYLKPLSDYGETVFQRIKIPTKPQWLLCNPCLINRQNGETELFVRSVNYITHVNNGEYSYPFGNVDTTTYVVSLSESDTKELSYDSPIMRNDMQKFITYPENDTTKYYDSMVVGFEDIRVIELNGKLYGFGMSRKTSSNNICQQVLIPLDENYQMEKVIVLNYDHSVNQKNWMPFVHNNEIHILYMCDPFVIIKPDLETGDCEIISRRNQKYNMSLYRGGSPGLSFDDGYLFVVHEVFFEGKIRKYIHRFLYMNKQFQISKISQPFFLKDKTIEFVIGLSYDPTGKYLCIGMGYQDRKAYLVKVDIDVVKNMLEYGSEIESDIILK